MSQRYAFYPGCTLHSTGVEFGVSTELVCDALDLEMVEIDDWNCCGASSAHSMDHTLFLALPARNLAKAQEVGLEDLAIPCAACYSRLAAADLALQEDGAFRARMESVLGMKYGERVRPRNLLDIIANDVSQETLKGKVKKPLAGLKVASYYGCLLIRPPRYTGLWDDPEHPQAMDQIVELMGAEAVPWSYGVDCCGGSLTLNRSDVVDEAQFLIYGVLGLVAFILIGPAVGSLLGVFILHVLFQFATCVAVIGAAIYLLIRYLRLLEGLRHALLRASEA